MARQASSKSDSGSSNTAISGKTVGEGMVAIERHLPRLKGMLPKGDASPALAESRTGFQPVPSGSNELKTRSTSHRSVDLLGQVYDWSGATKTTAGSPQGERVGVHQFYTPSCVVRCLVEMLAPYTALRGSAFLQSEASSQVVSAAKDKGRIYDPACGSGGNPRHSERRSEAETASRRLPAGRAQRGNFVEFHGGPGQRDSASSKREATHPGLKGNRGDISIYGQDKWVLSPRPFGLATRARRVRNGQGSESFWIAAAAGWEALMRAGSMRRFVHLKVISP